MDRGTIALQRERDCHPRDRESEFSDAGAGKVKDEELRGLLLARQARWDTFKGRSVELVDTHLTARMFSAHSCIAHSQRHQFLSFSAAPFQFIF